MAASPGERIRNGRQIIPLPTAQPVVCHVLHSLVVGGAELLACQFYRRSKHCTHSVFACLDELGPLGEELKREGVTVEVFHRQPGFDAGLVRRLHRFFREQRVSVIHAHQYAPFFYASLARLPGRLPPLIFTEHGRPVPDYKRRKRVLANKVLLGAQDRVIAVGSAVREALIINEGLARERVEVIRNGISVSSFSSSAKHRQRTRIELGLDDENFAIMQVARLNHLKDHQTALRAIRQVVDCCPNVRLLMIGDGEEHERLLSLVEELRIGPFVRFLGSRDDVAKLLSAADCFLLTSISEGIPLTLVEAMAASVPCIATRVGGIPEVIQDQESGVLVEPGNPQAVAEAIKMLVSQPGLRKKLSENGRLRAASKFDDQEMHAKYQAMYAELSTDGRRKIQARS